ncbi:HNH endonuclease signature motif containing protein [Sphingomonas sp. 28-63-12]|uniref:HNH endonuclease signature motif containing protein n=1 Tax=Sphingomonas sp. 28-63-12 TaxID=1970434 RepID=UPI000BCDDABD|nr:MAG: hypothetical protein B7Y47_10140 [Sphingomonas sp. 28-63-12]
MVADWPYNTAQWKRLRLVQLARHPLCEGCEDEGRLTMASVVDHRVAIRMGGPAFDPRNFASLCLPCHSAKTARGPEAGAVRTRKPRKGCNADGTPLDRRHPWHAGKSLRADRSKTAAQSNIELVQVDDLDDGVSDLWV